LVILDCDYAKAPENPCPAATDDVRDVLEYVFGRPEVFDLNKITTGGFSSGGNLALGMSVTLGKEASEGRMPFPVPPSRENNHPIKAVIAFYPSTDWEPDSDCGPPSGTNAPGLPISKDLIATFFSAYFYPPGPLTKEEDAKRKEQQMRTPLYTPRWAEPQYFPKLVGLITCEYDPLTLGTEGLRVDLMKEGDAIEVSGWKVKGVQHAWNNVVLPGQIGFEETKKAYDLAAMIIAKAGGVTI
jgi:acetyl esterase/lipase